MDDLALLKEMGDRTPLPSAEDLAPARAQLLAATMAQNGASVTPAGQNGARVESGQWNSEMVDSGRRGTVGEPMRLGGVSGRPARRRRRLLVSGIAVAGIAAAITGVVALGALEPVGVAPAEATAATILQEAAAVQRGLPSTPPRADQFIYTKSQGAGGVFGEAWLSADGTRDGLVVQGEVRDVIPGCRDGQAQVIKGDQPLAGVFEPCTPIPAYRTDLPTDVAGMRAYLDQNPKAAGKEILHLVDGAYVPPAAMAAIFEVMADFPGLTVTENATDAAGRSGVGVSWSTPGADGPLTNTLVFDEETRVFLGMSDGNAIVEQAIVDEAGQLPR